MVDHPPSGQVLDELLNRAISHHQNGDLAAAERCYRQVLDGQSNHVEAQHLLGLLRFQQGHHGEALDLIAAALRAKPDYAQAHYNRGTMLAQLERYAEALASFDAVLQIDAGNAAAQYNRGNALLKLKQYDEALASYDRVLARMPKNAQALSSRATALVELRRYDEALATFNLALALDPAAPGVLNNLGNALRMLKRYEEALARYDQALAISPDFVDALVNRGDVRKETRRYSDALPDYERALALAPRNIDAQRGTAEAALFGCDWKRVGRIMAGLHKRIAAEPASINPFTLLGYCDDPALQQQCAAAYAAERVPAMPAPLSGRLPRRRDRIRLAYVSADFHQHATAYLMAQLIELHDRSRFEVLGVALDRDDNSDMRRRLAAAFDGLHDGWTCSDRQVAALLHKLEVDIAVDLKGYTQHARPEIFAFRPAPIQVSYLGYPGTMSAPFIDYIIADDIVAPFDHQPFYTEKIVHLPGSYQVNDRQRVIAEHSPTRRQAGLPDNGFVFCCFNNNYKITTTMFDIWARLLQAVPGSVLWLLRGGAEDQLRREAQARGIDATRLVFAERAELAHHLARHRLADLFLDTLPVNAHTTASDALWAGLPVVTCCGRSFVARVGASLLRAVGLPDLVTATLADYEALALRLATDPVLLAATREKLARNRDTQPLFDSDRSRRGIEAAFSRMWEIWQRGEAPQSFSVKLD